MRLTAPQRPTAVSDAAAPAPTPRRTVRCPQCGGPSEYVPSNAWRPFCSERCRTLDLGAWASEAYRVAAPGTAAPADDDGEDGPAAAAPR